MSNPPDSKLLLVYDRECPVCSAYVRMLRLRRDVGELQLINAREDSTWAQRITEAGLDLDQGMVLMVEDQMYYGADAINRLALMSGRSGLFNRLNYHIFRSAGLSRSLYPVLRTGRNLLLRLLGRSKINNLDQT